MNSSSRKRDRVKVEALIERLYTMAMSGDVSAAALYLDRVVGPVRGTAETESLRDEGTRHSDSLTTMARPESGPSRSKRLLNVAEVAELLDISKSMVYTLQRTGRLKVCRVGRRVLVPAEDLERLINS